MLSNHGSIPGGMWSKIWKIVFEALVYQLSGSRTESSTSAYRTNGSRGRTLGICAHPATRGTIWGEEVVAMGFVAPCALGVTPRQRRGSRGPGHLLSSCSRRSANSRPEPATRSMTVRETST